MNKDLGANSGSREPNPQAVSALAGFDPGRIQRLAKAYAEADAALLAVSREGDELRQKARDCDDRHASAWDAATEARDALLGAIRGDA